MVGERGPELVNLPGGSCCIPSITPKRHSNGGGISGDPTYLYHEGYGINSLLSGKRQKQIIMYLHTQEQVANMAVTAYHISTTPVSRALRCAKCMMYRDRALVASRVHTGVRQLYCLVSLWLRHRLNETIQHHTVFQGYINDASSGDNDWKSTVNDRMHPRELH